MPRQILQNQVQIQQGEALHWKHTNECFSCRCKADLEVWQAEKLPLPLHFEGPSYQLYAVLGNLQSSNNQCLFAEQHE